MDVVDDGALSALSHGAAPAIPEAEEDREDTARTRVRGLVVLQVLARGYSLGQVSQLRSESLAELVVSLRDTLDALGVDTVRDGVREAQRRGLIL